MFQFPPYCSSDTTLFIDCTATGRTEKHISKSSNQSKIVYLPGNARRTTLYPISQGWTYETNESCRRPTTYTSHRRHAETGTKYGLDCWTVRDTIPNVKRRIVKSRSCIHVLSHRHHWKTRTINDCISKAFTIQQQQHRFVWLKPIHVKGMTLSPGSVDSIYKRHEMFGSYFVIGAPAMLTQNICCKRNLANGTEVAYHSLVLSELEDARHIQDRILNTQPGEDIFLRYPPQFIYVIITGSDPKNFENLTRIKDETVIPIGESFKGNKVKACVQENSGSTEINSTCHGIDNRFSITMHKLQGKTIHRLCADLNDHSFRPTIDFHGLFVTLSRVKNLKHFARLPYQISTTWIISEI